MIYMSEATVKSAKLDRKSADELRKMGIGKDDNGFYLLAAVALPTPSTGIMGMARAVTNVVKAVASVVEARVGAQATLETIKRRSEICHACYEVDSKGKRLFRVYSMDRSSCGQPMDPRADDAKVLRDPVLDGCGCWLEDKWASRDQACPRGKWGPEPVAQTAQSQSKPRCCGQ